MDHQDWYIRPVRMTDAASIRDLQKRLDRETPYMLWEPGEEPEESAAWEARLRPFLEEPRHAFWVAEAADSQLAGFARVRGNVARRLAHSALVVMGIAQSYWGQGIGTALLETIEHWAVQNQITRLELTVLASNRRAINLYLKAGFIVEGMRRHSIRYANGEFADEYDMAKLIEEA